MMNVVLAQGTRNKVAVVQVRALRVFGIGERLISVGEIVEVSNTRGEYLCFLGLVEKV